jgi:hypothetical protein
MNLDLVAESLDKVTVIAAFSGGQCGGRTRSNLTGRNDYVDDETVHSAAEYCAGSFNAGVTWLLLPFAFLSLVRADF